MKRILVRGLIGLLLLILGGCKSREILPSPFDRYRPPMTLEKLGALLGADDLIDERITYFPSPGARDFEFSKKEGISTKIREISSIGESQLILARTYNHVDVEEIAFRIRGNTVSLVTLVFNPALRRWDGRTNDLLLELVRQAETKFGTKSAITEKRWHDIKLCEENLLYRLGKGSAFVFLRVSYEPGICQAAFVPLL